MHLIDHFFYGPVTPILAYVMSCVGSFLGLLCTSRARGSSGRARAGWLILAAVSIGGTGIWVMHFIAMLGFEVRGLTIRYDIPLTLLSAVMAMLIVGAGLFIVGFGTSIWRLPLAGMLTGSGVATMHYTGMAAVQMHAHVTYEPLLFGASVVIAVVASTVALWFTLAVRGAWVTLAAALVMGVAVSGMHYTGMAAMRVHVYEAIGPPHGAGAHDFLLPLLIGVSVCTVVLITVIGVSQDEDELLAEASLRERTEPASSQDGGWFQRE